MVKWKGRMELCKASADVTEDPKMDVNNPEESYDGDEGGLILVRRGHTTSEKHNPITSHTTTKTSSNNKHHDLATEVWTSLKKTLFIIGSCVIIFIAMRNTLTLHLQNFWGASANFWQHQWDKLVEVFGPDPYNLIVYGTMLVSYLVYWTVGLFYILLDLTLKPAVFRKYKIQPGKNEPVGKWRLFKVIAVVHFNQLFVNWLAFVFGYHMMKLRGYDHSISLPTFHWVLFELVVFILMEEIGFYYSHRLFHHRFMYKRFHKLHHDWQAPISVTALYAHPLEHFCSNLMPGLLGPVLMGSHMATVWLWFQLAQLSTLNAHSGYHLPFFPSPEAHDYHHLKFNQCYGVLGILDLLHGTDDRFRASPCFSRHLLMLSLTPPRIAFPDPLHEDGDKPGLGSINSKAAEQ